MADPISIFGLAVTVGQIISTLYEYGQGVKDARKDVTQLSTELFTLKGVLEQIDAKHGKAFVFTDGEEVVRSTQNFLQSLLAKLAIPKSSISKAVQSLKWPFDKSDMTKHLARLERVKSWLILVFMTGVSQDTTDIRLSILDLSREFHDDLEYRRKLQEEHEDLEMLQWLAPVSPNEEHARRRQSRQSGSGQWFLDGYLRSWMTTAQSSVLCLHAGCGKSTLFSAAVDFVKDASRALPSTEIAYYYCSFDNEPSQRLSNILGSIIAQLTAQDHALLESIRPLYRERSRSLHRPPIELDKLVSILFQHISNHIGEVYILVDALNETSEGHDFMLILSTWMKRCKNIRTVITTTTRVTPSLDNMPIETIEVVPDTIKADIALFITQAITTRRTLLQLDDKLKDDIRDTLTRNADGSWVSLSLDNLSHQRTARAVRLALQSIPETLQDSYARLLRGIPEHDRIIAREALQWLSFSSRPLYLEELNEAVILEEDMDVIDQDARLQQINITLEICRGLVEVRDERVRLAHSSVKTFLTSEWCANSDVAFFALASDQGDKVLLRKCLQYLSLQELRCGPCLLWEALEKRNDDFPLIRYAAFHWALHARVVKLGAEEKSKIMQFLDTSTLPRGGNFGAWVQILVPDVDIQSIESTQPLYYAASFGLLDVVKAILEADMHINIDAGGGRRGSTPMFVACWRGYFDVASVLHDAGARVDIEDPSTFYTVVDLLEHLKSSNILAWELLNKITASPGSVQDNAG